MSHFLPKHLMPSVVINSGKMPAEYVLNRNPLNLLNICIGYKPSGWWLENSGRNYWHKLVIDKSGRNVTAYVKHYTGFIPLKASTTEWSIKKHLYSTTGRSAYVNIGRILAWRCLQSGITEMIFNQKPADGLTGSNTAALLAEVVAGGVSLTEPDRYFHPSPSDVTRPEKPWCLQV